MTEERLAEMKQKVQDERDRCDKECKMVATLSEYIECFPDKIQQPGSALVGHECPKCGENITASIKGEWGFGYFTYFLCNCGWEYARPYRLTDLP